MLSTPTASINMQNRTARLISLAHCAEGFLLHCHGILAAIIGLDVELANFSDLSEKLHIYIRVFMTALMH